MKIEYIPFQSITESYKHYYHIMDHFNISNERVRVGEDGCLARLREEIMKKNPKLYFLSVIDDYYIKHVLGGRRPRKIVYTDNKGIRKYLVRRAK